MLCSLMLYMLRALNPYSKPQKDGKPDEGQMVLGFPSSFSLKD